MTDRFVFYSRSADNKAGYGTGEEKKSDLEYKELNNHKHWRRILSNFYVSQFTLDNNQWSSVEHFFHAVKFRDDKKSGKNYEYYKTFTLYSNSPWNKDPILAKQAGKAGRISEITGKIYDKKIDGVKIPKDIKMRDDFYTKNIPSILQKFAMLAKFTQNTQLKQILLDTKDAELWHYVGRGKLNQKD